MQIDHCDADADAVAVCGAWNGDYCEAECEDKEGLKVRAAWAIRTTHGVTCDGDFNIMLALYLFLFFDFAEAAFSDQKQMFLLDIK